MKPVKTHSFRGTKYKVTIQNVILYGRCDGVGKDRRTERGIPKLSVYDSLPSKSGLETCIHEALHACCFAKSEKVVKESAEDIARFLWRLGFRYHGTQSKRARMA